MILVKCPNGHALQVDDRHAGKKGRCPFCKSSVQIPPLPAGTGQPPIEPKAPPPRPPIVDKPTAPPPKTPAPIPAKPPAPKSVTPLPPVEPPVPVDPPIPVGRTVQDASDGPVKLTVIFSWLTEGLLLGLKRIVPLTLAILIVMTLGSLSSLACALPGLVVWPALVGGLVLVFLAAVRGEKGFIAKVFQGFTGGRLVTCLQTFWLLWLILMAAAIPTAIVTAVVGLSWMLTVLQKGIAGLGHLLLVWLVTLPMVYLASRLVWMFPLVMEGRGTPLSALGESWRMTARVAKGWGMVVLFVILSLVSSIGNVVTASWSTALFAGTLVATQRSSVSVAAAEAQADSLPRRPGETDDAYALRKAMEIYRLTNRPVPPREQGETYGNYATRLTMTAHFKALGEDMSRGGGVGGLKLGLLLAGAVTLLITSAVGAIVWMPVFVGYVKMVPDGQT